jgi:hypothetical protein
MNKKNTFHVRSKQFRFSTDAMSSNWNDNSPCLTQIFNVASIIAEQGEAVMVKKSSQYLKEINDETLKTRVKIFFGQEATHRNVHIHYNQCLRGVGYRVDLLFPLVKAFLTFLVKFLPDKWLLASMVSSEYITSMIAERTFERGFGSDVINSDNEIARFWRWHLAEEVEHRTVLHELYIASNGSKGLLFLMTWLMSGLFYILLNIGILIFMTTGKGSIYQKIGSFIQFNIGSKGASWWLFKKLLKGSFQAFDAAHLCQSTKFARYL